MPTRSRIIQRTIGVLAASAFVLIPPVLFVSGVIVYAAITYDGICPGIMDIPSYPCSMWEYIGRHTISPFALPVHLVICGGWFGLSLVLMILVFAIWWLVGRSADRTHTGEER